MTPRLGRMAAPFALAMAAACGNAFSASPSTDGGTDATSDAPLPDASSDVSPDASGEAATDGTAPAHVVFVSAVSGDDGNDGLSKGQPKKSIAAGLVAAAKLGAGTEVHVCKGVYVETALNLSAPVSLLGSWDCASWTRTATFGYPKFDGVNATTIQNANPTAQAATLLVSGSVPATSVVDGLDIQGAATLGATTLGIGIVDQAAAHVRDDVVTGGGGNGGTSTAGSAGISVSAAASPEIERCGVSGGSGTGAIGSVGIATAGTGTPYFHDNSVSGGTGTAVAAGGSAAVGMNVYTSLSGAHAIANSLVYGTDSQGVASASEGIVVGIPNGTVDIVGCEIRGGSGTGTQTVSVGIRVNATGTKVQVIADRIYGGARSGASSVTYGVLAENVGSISVVDSFVHGGTIGATSSTAVAVQVVGAQPAIVYDTLYTGAGSGTGIALSPATTGAVITDDLIVGGHAGNYGVFATTCTSIATLDHTVFANIDTALYDCSGTGGAPITTMSGLVAQFPSASTDRIVENNTACVASLDSSYCIPDPSCPAPSTTCLPSLFGASWTPGDDGLAGLFHPSGADGGASLGGWTLAPPVPCALAKGGAPVTGIATDGLGATRSATTPTVGAAEVTGSCLP